MSNTEPSVNTSTVTPASSQPDQITTTPQQKLLQEARAKLKLEHAENTQAVIDPSETESPVAPASSQPDQITTTPQQKVLQEARAKLKLEHAKKTQAVVDPSEETSPRVTGRQEAKAPKLHPAADIPTASTKTPWAKLSSSEQYLRQPEHPSVVPFYSQFEEVDRPAVRLGPPPLPEGWTEHKAPTGQPYYHNDSTRQSTYTRPLPTLQTAVQYSNQFTSDITGQLQNGHAASNPFGTHRVPLASGGIGNHSYGNGNSWRGRGNGRGGLANQQRAQPKDRSKSKYDIPGCEPWVLVKTKLGRQFVYNSEKDESFWRIPPDVMRGVDELEKRGWEKRTEHEKNQTSDEEEDVAEAKAESELAIPANVTPTVAPGPGSSLVTNQETNRLAFDSDGEEYEEVEVTDNEDEEIPSKRLRTEEENVEQPVEFNEDDIAFQLAAMGQDYGLDPGEYGDGDEELVEGAEGLALTEEDAKALFKDMLSDQGISPYMTWEKIMEAGRIVEDERYTALPNMRSRKEVWGEWTRGMIQRLKEQQEQEEKKDPKIPYFVFLQKNATPKLYWPEFRRKYRKEPEMYTNKLSDKNREKWYRDYISRLKLPEATLKSDLVKLLKSIPLYALNESISVHALPTTLLTDLRYISLRPAIRDPLIEAHISTLPPAPTDLEISPEEQEAQTKARQERLRRQEALTERQRQVQEEKRKQNGALRYSKGMLREGEEELQRAMRIGKEGLLGHMAEEE